MNKYGYNLIIMYGKLRFLFWGGGGKFLRTVQEVNSGIKNVYGDMFRGEKSYIFSGILCIFAQYY